MQFTVYYNSGKTTIYPFLLDVTNDIIGQLNRRIVIPLLPIEKYPGGNRPERMIPLIMLINGKEYAVMTHELASVPISTFGAELCNVQQYRSQVKAAIDFLLDGI